MESSWRKVADLWWGPTEIAFAATSLLLVVEPPAFRKWIALAGSPALRASRGESSSR